MFLKILEDVCANKSSRTSQKKTPWESWPCSLCRKWSEWVALLSVTQVAGACSWETCILFFQSCRICTFFISKLYQDHDSSEACFVPKSNIETRALDFAMVYFQRAVTLGEGSCFSAPHLYIKVCDKHSRQLLQPPWPPSIFVLADIAQILCSCQVRNPCSQGKQPSDTTRG